MLEVLDDNCAL